MFIHIRIKGDYSFKIGVDLESVPIKTKTSYGCQFKGIIDEFKLVISSMRLVYDVKY